MPKLSEYPSAQRRVCATRFAPDSPLEESGFEPPVPPATEMLIELAKGIPHATRMLAVGDDWAGAAIVLT